MRSSAIFLLVSFCFSQLTAQVRAHGAIVRMDTTQRDIHLVFTGHEYAEGADTILAVLKSHDIRASFFFTGDFLRNPQFAPAIRRLVMEGHYVGPHSDRHLLYCTWEDRDSLLVPREEFIADLEANYRELERFGIMRSAASVFLPPYEWYNDSIACWSRQMSITLVNFTPGTSSNADYTRPGIDPRYVSSDTILQRILRHEHVSSNGLNGFILLLHIGAGPHRPDPFHRSLDLLLTELKARGYRFRRF
ncbi:MAG: polysaccharide deacetylase family protein [Bacteroidetes bacterium]|nr:polysaccharide deacetylase family protein [Bacteroidota bacterium]